MPEAISICKLHLLSGARIDHGQPLESRSNTNQQHIALPKPVGRNARVAHLALRPARYRRNIHGGGIDSTGTNLISDKAAVVTEHGPVPPSCAMASERRNCSLS